MIEVDGRTIGAGRPGPVTARLWSLYLDAVEADVVAGAGPG